MTVSIRRTAKGWHRLYREIRMVALALRCPRHPVLAHIVVTRRCNLACTYCSEFDDYSQPVPTDEMFRRIDQLAALGTTVITMTGGEPLLHPDLDEIIRRIRSHGIIAILVTNGYLLNVDRIKKLNRAGLDHMQISVDNVQPDEVSKKSLKVLDQRLQWLAQHAEFRVSIHSVLGACTARPEEALTISRRAKELGLISTAGIVHDASGQLRPLSAEQQQIMEEIDGSSNGRFSAAWHNPWRKNLIRGLPNDWHCGAGGRHLLHLRKRPGPLLYGATWISGDPALAIYAGGHRTRIEGEEVLRALLHHFLHSTRGPDRPGTSESQAGAGGVLPARDADGNERCLPLPIRVLSSLFASPKGGKRNRLAQKTALKLLKNATRRNGGLSGPARLAPATACAAERWRAKYAAPGKCHPSLRRGPGVERCDGTLPVPGS